MTYNRQKTKSSRQGSESQFGSHFGLNSTSSLLNTDRCEQEPNNNLFQYFQQKVAAVSQQLPSGIYRRSEELGNASRNRELQRLKKQSQLEIVEVQMSPSRSNSKHLNRNSVHQSVHKMTCFCEQQHEAMNDQLKQLHQVTSDLVKEIKNIAKDMKVVKADSQKNQGAIDLVVKEVNRMMAKKEEAIGCLRLQGKAMREQIDGINKRNCRFEEEVEQKIERIANQNNVKSKEYNMGLKSSLQGGISSSVSMMMGSVQNVTTKTVSELLIQIESLKRQIDASNNRTNLVQFKLNDLLVNKPNTLLQSKPTEAKEFELQKERLNEQSALNSTLKRQQQQLIEKTSQVQSKIKRLEEVSRLQTKDIEGMNEQLTAAINGNLGKRLKTLELAFAGTDSKVRAIVHDSYEKQVKETLEKCRIINVRRPTATQATKLCLLRDEVQLKETYLLDEQNYLLDHRGVYLTEEKDGICCRIQVANQLICLMQAQGIDIMGR